MSSWQPHILVVDDDKRLRDLLRKYLMDQGYLVSTAPHPQDAAPKLEAVQFDLMVLDVMMPGEDGFSFTRRLRQDRRFKNLPILLLTARGESSDRISGLETGSDDYLVKPFEPRELQLRIQAILRRAPKEEEAREIWIGRWLYDAGRGELRDETDVLRLTDVEAGLLKVLADAPFETISREELVKRSALPVNDRTVDVQVTRLRRKIEPDPKQPRYLVTVRGEGYRLLPEREKINS
ncbi:MAG TPA: response regulator [Alphaproteobacteria bacterium]|nr:response regulator [Alphaproteobacteria bacterium]